MVVLLSKLSPHHHPLLDIFLIYNLILKTRKSDGKRYPRSVQKFTTSEFDDFHGSHPTQKPVALLEYLIKTYTNENETILDNTMGSGSTGVACVNTSRNFIGMELDPKYFKIAEQRIME